MPPLYPKFWINPDFSEDNIPEYGPSGYYMTMQGRAWSTINGEFLRFLRKDDCQIACDSFIKKGLITEEQIMELSDDEMRRIACENLQW